MRLSRTSSRLTRPDKNKAHTPKWALKHGLVEDYEAKRRRKREWASRYGENHATNPYDEEGAVDEYGNPIAPTRSNGGEEHLRTVGAGYGPLDPHEENPENEVPTRRGDREDYYRPGQASSAQDFSDLPGAGDRLARQNQGSSIAKLKAQVTGKPSKSSGKDRFARMEEAQHTQSAAEDVDTSWINEGRNGSSAAPKPIAKSDPFANDAPRQYQSSRDPLEHNF